MEGEAKAPSRGVAQGLAATLALALSGAVYLISGDVGVGMADEGFLWYGAQRTALGEVPLRDFQSYEPLRYYWCAAWSHLFGDGLLGLRLSAAAFQALALFFGLLAARRATTHPWQLAIIAPVLVAWMFPRYKLFDSGVSLMAVYGAVRLVESPSVRAHFLVGCFTGLVGFLGRNHALYALLGFDCLIFLLHFKHRPGNLGRRLGGFACGVLAGYAPMLVMAALVPGFAHSYLDSLLFFLHHGSNLPIPYPWPWRLGYEHLRWFERAGLAAAVLLPVVIYPAGLWVALRTKPEALRGRSLLIGSAFIGAFYIHHVAVRSDFSHLAQSFLPALLALFAFPLALPRARAVLARSASWGALALVTLLAAPATNPELARFSPGADAPTLVRVEVAGDPLWLHPGQAAYFQQLGAVVHQRVAPEDTLFIAPNAAALYPVLGKVSPTWGIYFLWVADEKSQERIIGELTAERVRWALIIDNPVAGRRELLFRNSHPLVWQYLVREFEPVPLSAAFRGHHLLRRRSESGPERPPGESGAAAADPDTLRNQ
jgi:hypothetical protein